MKEQYDRDTNNLHKKHEEAVAKLQEQHEQAMKELREELEKEINSLREQLRKCQGKGSVDKASLTSKTMEMVDIKPKRCTCGSKLERILQKALKNGLEVCFLFLTFCHTCFFFSFLLKNENKAICFYIFTFILGTRI